MKKIKGQTTSLNNVNANYPKLVFSDEGNSVAQYDAHLPSTASKIIEPSKTSTEEFAVIMDGFVLRQDNNLTESNNQIQAQTPVVLRDNLPYTHHSLSTFPDYPFYATITEFEDVYFIGQGTYLQAISKTTGESVWTSQGWEDSDSTVGAYHADIGQFDRSRGMLYTMNYDASNNWLANHFYEIDVLTGQHKIINTSFDFNFFFYSGNKLILVDYTNYQTHTYDGHNFTDITSDTSIDKYAGYYSMIDAEGIVITDNKYFLHGYDGTAAYDMNSDELIWQRTVDSSFLNYTPLYNREKDEIIWVEGYGNWAQRLDGKTGETVFEKTDFDGVYIEFTAQNFLGTKFSINYYLFDSETLELIPSGVTFPSTYMPAVKACINNKTIFPATPSFNYNFFGAVIDFDSEAPINIKENLISHDGEYGALSLTSRGEIVTQTRSGNFVIISDREEIPGFKRLNIRETPENVGEPLLKGWYLNTDAHKVWQPLAYLFDADQNRIVKTGIPSINEGRPYLLKEDGDSHIVYAMAADGTFFEHKVYTDLSTTSNANIALSNSGYAYTNANERINIWDGTTETISGIPTGDSYAFREYFPIVWDGTKEYFTRTSYSYEPGTDTWATIATIPNDNAREVVLYNNTLYVLAHDTVASRREYTIYKYDITANVWSTEVEIPGNFQSSQNIMMFEHGGILYMPATGYKYDTASQELTTWEGLPGGIHNSHYFIHDNIAYMVLGYVDSVNHPNYNTAAYVLEDTTVPY